MLVNDSAGPPFGAQIIGCDPGMMAEAAAILEELGFRPDRHNLGFRSKKVVSNGEGSALLKDPVKASRVPRGAAGRQEGPVTMKMRQGLPGSVGRRAAESPAAPRPRLSPSPCTPHAGSAVRGPRGLEAIGKVKRAVKIPVIATATS